MSIWLSPATYNKIKATAKQRSALKKRSDWADIKSKYGNRLFKKSKFDLKVVSKANDERVTDNIDEASIHCNVHE